MLNDPTLAGITQAHGKSLDVPVVVKSIRAERLRENIDVFDFRLTADEMSAIAGLGRRQSLMELTHQDPRMPELLLTLK